jgi:hypothetical protein
VICRTIGRWDSLAAAHSAENAAGYGILTSLLGTGVGHAATGSVELGVVDCD